jgi:hypothetical protein
MSSINYIYIINIGVVVLLALWILAIELRLKKIFNGGGSKNLEQILSSFGNELKKLDISREETEKYLITVERRLRQSVQNVNTIRFNPFQDSGSNQSFAVAFLNEKGDGVVISSLYSREKVSVYAKPIKNYASEYTLSEEEKRAINEIK